MPSAWCTRQETLVSSEREKRKEKEEKKESVAKRRWARERKK